LGRNARVAFRVLDQLIAGLLLQTAAPLTLECGTEVSYCG